MRESELQSQVLEYLRSCGCFVLRMNTQGIQHTINGKKIFKKNPNKGMADILVHFQGKTFWIELKTEKGKVSPDQEAFEKNVVAQGISYYLFRDLESVIDLVSHLKAA